MERLKQELQAFFENMRYYAYGYSIDCLHRILPADIPVVIAANVPTEEEIRILKNNRDRICIFAWNTTLKCLVDAGIRPDIWVVSNDSIEIAGLSDESMAGIPAVVSTNARCDIMRQHQGQKFFYWTGSPLEQEVVEGAVEASALVYHYNNIVGLSGGEVALNLSEWLADYMEASSIVILGREGELEEALANNTSAAKVDMASILADVLPFFDDNGRNYMETGFAKIAEEYGKASELFEDNGRLYHRLYELALQGIVTQEELNAVTEALNHNAELMEKSEYIRYLFEIFNSMDAEDETGNYETPNEIAQVAAGGILANERMLCISESIQEGARQFHLKEVPGGNVGDALHIPNILIMYGESQYSVLPYFAKELKKGFRKLGYHVYVVDATSCKYEANQGYNHYQNTIGYDYVLFINGIGIKETFEDQVLQQKRHLFDHPNTKPLALFVDHPTYQKERLSYAGDSVQVIFADKNWAEAAVKDGYVEKSCFLPLGGIEQPEGLAFAERENKIVFFGSHTDLKQLEHLIEQSGYAALIWEIIHRLIANPKLTIEQAVEQLIQKRGCAYSIRNILKHTDVLCWIDSYIRKYFRQKTIETIAKSGLPLDVYGWKERELLRYPNVSLREVVSMEEMLSICRHTRFVLNVNPWIKEGTQERVFNTMLSGAIAVTDETNYLLQECKDKENILFYQLNQLEKLPQKLSYYLENEAEAAQIAKSGYRLAEEKHTWTKRAEQLSEVMRCKS